MSSPKLISIAGNVTTDSLSQVRGLGRYVNGLIEALTEGRDFAVASSYHRSVDCAINPFVNLLAPPHVRIFLQKSKKRIAILHDIIPLEFPGQFPIGMKGLVCRECNKLLLSFYDHVVTDSQTSSSLMQRFLRIPAARISVIYPFSPLQHNSIQTTTSLLPSEIRPKEYFLYVGDVNWHKNVVSMARAAIQTRQKLVCVGGAFMNVDTSHPWLNELRTFLDIAKQNPHLIIRTGYVNDNTLASLYEHALANILVSYEEGFGYSYVEAGAFNTPSILSDKPIFHEISNEKGALFVNPENVDLIAQAMQIFLQKPQKGTELGQEAYERSLSYSKTAFHKSWSDLIHIL